MEKQNIKNLSWKIITTVVVTLTAVFTVWVYAAFIEPTIGPNDLGWEQDFAQNILGANNADNSFDSSAVVANKDGSIIERLQYMSKFYTSECGESTTSTQTNCYVDTAARYLTTNLCDSAKENSCFIPTNNSYYAFGTECADSTTTTKTNCYIDDTAKYADSSVCSAASNSGYCFMNTATFSAMDADLAASNIKNGVTILGVTGTLASAKFNPDYKNKMRIAAFVEPSSAPTDYNQDFAQNIIGANNADNNFNSSSVVADNSGSIIERLEYLTGRLVDGGLLYDNECGESTISTQTNCYVDNTARYLTTNLCDSAKENQCFVPTDNNYYAFGAECSDSTTSTQTNCYIDDTARYIDSDLCSASANTGYCYINTDTFTSLDADLVASNIKNGVTIFGVTGTYGLANGSVCVSAGACLSGYCYVDEDGDRYAPSSGTKKCQTNSQLGGVDYCDSDATSNPGYSGGYKSTTNACGSFDWNSNGTVDQTSYCFDCTGASCSVATYYETCSGSAGYRYISANCTNSTSCGSSWERKFCLWQQCYQNGCGGSQWCYLTNSQTNCDVRTNTCGCTGTMYSCLNAGFTADNPFEAAVQCTCQ
ncbi:MAG: hypothetical protein WC582_04635 [Patescibacteria group bacterium]